LQAYFCLAFSVLTPHSSFTLLFSKSSLFLVNIKIYLEFLMIFYLQIVGGLNCNMGQMVLCFPLLVALSHATLQTVDRRGWETAITLGAVPLRAVFTVLKEARFGLIAAVIAAFGRIIAEVGSSMMVGGNILHYTRNIPTAIALETSKGSFAQGIALGIVLLVMALVLNLFLTYIQGRGELSL
jgi:tungstate transport system permease protein